MTNTIHAGHGGKGSPVKPMDPGAVGNGTTEHKEMLWLTSQMLKYLNWTDATDKQGQTIDNNLINIVNTINRVARWSDTNISNHMNAFNTKATGVEVWYYLGDAKGKALAEKLSAAIANALGLVNRGAKATTDLYVVRETVGLTVLIEWCFIDNASDMRKWNQNKFKAIDAALNVLGVKTNSGGTNVQKVKAEYYSSGTHFEALTDLKTYTKDWSKVDKTWFLKKGSKFSIDPKRIVITKNGTTHAPITGLSNTYVSLYKGYVRPQ